MNILLLNGSPAQPSHTSATLAFLDEIFQENGHDSRVVDLLDLGLPTNDPVYHKDAQESPDQKIRDFAMLVKNADIVVLGTPLYHGLFSGLLKSALDNLDDDAFYKKKILLVSNASGARGSMQAAQHLVVVPRTMGGLVHNRLIGTYGADFEESDEGYILTSEEIINRCQQIVSEILS